MTRGTGRWTKLVRLGTGHMIPYYDFSRVTRLRTTQTDFPNNGRSVDTALITGHEEVTWADISAGDIVIRQERHLEHDNDVYKEVAVRVTDMWDLPGADVQNDSTRDRTPEDNLVATVLIPNETPHPVPRWTHAVIRDNASQELFVIDQNSPERVAAVGSGTDALARNGTEQFTVKRLRDLNLYEQTSHSAPPESAGDLVFDFEYSTLLLVTSLIPHYTPPPPPPEDEVEETSPPVGS